MYLDKNDLCSIYEHRPMECNGEILYRDVFSLTHTKAEFVELANKYCNEIRRSKL